MCGRGAGVPHRPTRYARSRRETSHDHHRSAAPLDAEKLEQFVFRAVDEVGATLNAALVVMGDRLGLYRALAGAGPLTSGELADAHRHRASATCANGSTPRPPAASSTTTPRDGRYSLPPEQAVALTDEDSPAYLPGFFQIALRLGARLATDHRRLPQRRRASAGTSTTTTVHDGCERFFRPGYNAQPRRVAGCPRSTASSTSSQRGAQRRRRRLRPRRLDDPDGAGASRTRRSSAPTTTPARSRPRARRAARGRRRATASRFEAAPAAALQRRAATTW